MFLSLKKHLDGGASELSDALLQLSQMLLRALRLHAVRGEAGDLHRFQASILLLEQRVGPSPDPKEVLVVAGEAAKAFEDYSYQTTRFLSVQSAELTNMISMLTSTVATISASSETAVAQLAKVEKRLEHIGNNESLAMAKSELADCLALVRQEAKRQREQTENTIHTLQRGVSDARQRVAEAGALADESRPTLFRDPVTSLPCRADAEDALTQVRRKPNHYVAILPVDRFSLILSRFGIEAGDKVACFLATHLAHHLQPKDRLFRWSDNAFLLIVERNQTADSVRADISRFASNKLEHTLEHHGREILLPISSSWVMLAASEGGSRDALIGKIDNFLNNHVHSKESFA
ncbi:MAG: diguanylate cyclase [Acidobacteria bacterium]|nr:diguanylate cyclase [Acidobacteriota bacterium]